MRYLLTLCVVVWAAGSLGAQDTVPWLQSSNEIDAMGTLEIYRKMSEPSPLVKDLNAVPLSNVMSRFPFKVVIDEKALQEESISPDEPITLPSIPGISIRNHIKLILSPLELTFLEEPGYLLVTTKKSSANVLRLYDVTDFVRVSKDGYNFSPLVRIIEDSIESYDWQRNGGCSNLIEWRTPQAAILVVNASSSARDSIRDLLNSQKTLLRMSVHYRNRGHLHSSEFQIGSTQKSVRRSMLGR